MKRIPMHCTAWVHFSYNKAALVLKNAAPLANSDKAKYDAQKEIADKNFQNAKTYLSVHSSYSRQTNLVKKV